MRKHKVYESPLPRQFLSKVGTQEESNEYAINADELFARIFQIK